MFESELSRTFAGAQPSDVEDLYIPPPGTEYHIQDSGLFNASVGKINESTTKYNFFLGLHLGIVDAVCTLACTEGFFPEIEFDCDVQTVVLPELPFRYIDYSFLFSQNAFRGLMFGKYLNVNSGKEADAAARGRLGNHLMGMCLRFVSYHEQAHFILGHLGFAEREFGIRTLYELPMPGESNGRLSDSSVSRTLEIHADANAIGLLLGHRPGSRFAKETKSGLALPQARDPMMWSKCVLASVAIVTAIIERAERCNASGDHCRTHPYATTRLLHALKYADVMLHDLFTESDRRAFLQSVLDDLNFVFSFFDSNISLKYDANAERNYCSTASINEEFTELEDKLKDVAPALQPVTLPKLRHDLK